MPSTSISPEKIKLEFSNIKENFTNEINDPLKKRIVFSGAFGSGKTTFLRDYFANNSNYLPIHIFPVNYAVSSNEDIFELIKFDILYKLLDHKPDFEKLSVTHFQTLAFLSSDDLIKILTPFIKSIDLIDKTIFGVFESLKILKKTLQDKKDEVDKSQAKAIEIFFKTFQLEKGNIYEHDFYTELLNTLITNIENNSGKKLVLIIDDLDRIDPEHIFRILNVFAAHFDLETDRNKFGLSKVILACDINNIKRIFEHRYGEGVDFSGYINKFYSTGVFKFNNTPILQQEIRNILDSIQIETTVPFSNITVDEGRTVRNIVIYFLQELILNQKIQLRDLTKFSNETLTIKNQIINLGRKINVYEIKTLLAFEYLILFFGDSGNLISALNSMQFTPMDLFFNKKIENKLYLNLDFLGDLFLISDSQFHNFREGTYNYSDKDGNNWGVEYKIRQDFFERNIFYFQVEPFSNDSDKLNNSRLIFTERENLNLKPLLIRALKKYVEAPKY